MKKILVLFDIDGTILKLKKFRSKSIFRNLFLDIFGANIDEQKMPDFAGNTDLGILRAMAESHSIPYETIINDIDRIWEKILNDFKPYCNPEYINLLPGADMLIKILAADKTVQLGLLTGNFKANAYLKLDAFGLRTYFPFGAFGDDNEDRNKLPALALDRAVKFSYHSFNEKNTIIIGDSPRDIICGKSNNIPVLSVATGGFPVDLLVKHNPEIIFEDFSDYNSVIDRIFNFFGE
jgi:phosphoglycolate phosphatase